MTEPTEWKARFALDLHDDPRASDFDVVSKGFDEWIHAEPVTGPVGIENGWHTITPQMAEAFLRRNPAGANRKVSLPTVIYYAAQMEAGDWPKTGETLIFSVDGTLHNGQHRLYAAYLSGCSFETYVVADVPEFPQLFAYIDNGRSRTATSALQTAGFNGVSGLMSRVLDIAYNVEHGLYLSGTKVGRRPRMAPIGYLRSMENHPHVRSAARQAVSDFAAASDLLDKEVVAYGLMAITDLHGEHTAAQFFEEFIGEVEAGPDSPALALKALMEKDVAKEKGGMKKNVKLGNLILAFNAWMKGETLKKRWALQAHEDFPVFIEAEGVAQAAE
jgi:hypothetical protein